MALTLIEYAKKKVKKLTNALANVLAVDIPFCYI